MGRADKRKQQRREQKEEKEKAASAARQLAKDIRRNGIFDGQKAMDNPAYLAEIKRQRAAQLTGYAQNGITKEDLKREFDLGYAAARQDYEKRQRDYYVYLSRMFYAALCIALKRKFRFGKIRIGRALEEVKQLMLVEICTADIIESCKRETGVEIDIEEMEAV